MLAYIVSYIIMLLLIPLFDAFLKNVKNILQGRKLISFFQTYYDLIKLFKKSNFKSEFTSFISFIAPVFILAVSLSFLFFIPIVNNAININILVLFHILGLGAFFLMIYALDNATYFGGLGASREAFVLAIVEPVSILLILGFVVVSGGSMDIASISSTINSGNSYILYFFEAVIITTLFVILLAENKRFPFDNPSTHLELTMIHEAMLLETTGPRLAILEMAAKITLIGFINLLIFLTWQNSSGGTIEIFLIHILKVLFILFIIGVIEVFITKMRLFKYQNVFGFLLIIQLIVILFYILSY